MEIRCGRINPSGDFYFLKPMSGIPQALATCSIPYSAEPKIKHPEHSECFILGAGFTKISEPNSAGIFKVAPRNFGRRGAPFSRFQVFP